MLTPSQAAAQTTGASLACNLIAAAQAYGPRPALRLEGDELTYDQLATAAAGVAAMLADRGVEAGDRVGIMLPNVPDFAVAYYGALLAGGAVVPMNVLLKQREVAFYLGDSDAKIVFAWHEFEAAARAGAHDAGADCVVVRPGTLTGLHDRVYPLADAAERAADDTAVILYTSGTTGKPKGAELTHANLRRNVEIARALFSATEHDVILGALPLFHSFGQTCGLNSAVAAGACLDLIPRFMPATVLETIERDKVTIFEGVPTMYSALLGQPGREQFDVSSLRVCVSGGAALPVETLRAFEQTFDCVILEGYGLSETSPIASFNHPDRVRKAGSIGTPVEGVEMRVVDAAHEQLAVNEVGEIAIRGHNVMKGYWRREEATAEAIDADGWFYTGDLARMDDDGYFFIVDRKKDMIIRGGYNVYPREIEEVLYEHPAVREAAVIGVPDGMLGEEVGAAVSLKDGHSASEEEIREFVRSQVAAYKYPRHVWFLDELPKTATGKILKRAIEAPAHLR